MGGIQLCHGLPKPIISYARVVPLKLVTNYATGLKYVWDSDLESGGVQNIVQGTSKGSGASSRLA